MSCAGCAAGMQGRVYRGTLDGQAVAVKVVDNLSMLRKLGAMPLEAVLLQDLRHECIVTLLQQSFTAPGSERQLWLVMELCDKGPLDVRPMPFSFYKTSFACVAWCGALRKRDGRAVLSVVQATLSAQVYCKE